MPVAGLPQRRDVGVDDDEDEEAFCSLLKPAGRGDERSLRL